MTLRYASLCAGYLGLEVYVGDVLTDPAWKGLPARQIMRRVGKKRAGRLLDGRTHDGYPAGAS